MAAEEENKSAMNPSSSSGVTPGGGSGGTDGEGVGMGVKKGPVASFKKRGKAGGGKNFRRRNKGGKHYQYYYISTININTTVLEL